jgi:hypothetical protein
MWVVRGRKQQTEKKILDTRGVQRVEVNPASKKNLKLVEFNPAQSFCTR